MTLIFLVLAVGLALAFEFVNGFHDTANAVATVIYTNALKPTQAVMWSGVWNLIGVLTSSTTVAFGVVALLPVDLLLNVGSAAGFAAPWAAPAWSRTPISPPVRRWPAPSDHRPQSPAGAGDHTPVRPTPQAGVTGYRRTPAPSRR